MGEIRLGCIGGCCIGCSTISIVIDLNFFAQPPIVAVTIYLAMALLSTIYPQLMIVMVQRFIALTSCLKFL